MAEDDISEPLGKFRLVKKIGEGSFGQLYRGVNVETDEQVAIKLEKSDGNKQKSLLFEFERYRKLGDHEGIPKMYGFKPYRDGKFDALILQLLGKSVEELFEFCGRQFSLKTLLQIVIQMINRIEYVHEKKIVYRDTKPENFMFGQQNSKYRHVLFIIDFGLSKEYVNEEGEHIAKAENVGVLGTARYMSINTHLGVTQSRRDDLEALAYVWVYLFKGRLPWQGLKGSGTERYNLIRDMKRATPIETLCQGMPKEFVEYLRKVRALAFTEKANYDELRSLFTDLFVNKGFAKDDQYDWSGMDWDQANDKSAKQSSSNIKIQPKSRMRS